MTNTNTKPKTLIPEYESRSPRPLTQEELNQNGGSRYGPFTQKELNQNGRAMVRFAMEKGDGDLEKGIREIKRMFPHMPDDPICVNIRLRFEREGLVPRDQDPSLKGVEE